MNRTFQLTEGADGGQAPVPIDVVAKGELDGWLAERDDRTRRWIAANGFKGKAGELCLVPGADGGVASVLAGRGPETPDVWRIADLPGKLPEAVYRLESGAAPGPAALGWALGSYRFDLYKKPKKALPELLWPDGADRDEVTRLAGAVCLVRDLINTPAQDMGPSALAEAAQAVAEAAGAKVSVVVGDDLLKENYPAIHAVGRAAQDPPRLIDLRWGDENAPKVTLVGKGVCFDSGGLDIKSAANMKYMKKDMGGAATVLGLAQAVMAAGLELRLRVLIPAVENAVAGNAYHPMDVIRTRGGPTVEIGHTDAEGRVVLADALALASEETPDLILDVATLTGAARVALGPQLPALFSDDDALAGDLLSHGQAADDPLWRLPLWGGYRELIDGKTADITNAAEGSFAGAITAALFLKEFVGPDIAWAHIDSYGWNATDRPGRPKGGEALALRAAYAMLKGRYG